MAFCRLHEEHGLLLTRWYKDTRRALVLDRLELQMLNVREVRVLNAMLIHDRYLERLLVRLGIFLIVRELPKLGKIDACRLVILCCLLA